VPRAKNLLLLTPRIETATRLQAVFEHRAWRVSWSRRLGDAAHAFQLGADVVIADLETPREMAELSVITRAVLVPRLIVRASALAARQGIVGAPCAALRPGPLDVASLIATVDLLFHVGRGGAESLPVRVPPLAATKWVSRFQVSRGITRSL
jgi:hypothetical protein